MSEKTFTGSDALIQCVQCGFLNVPFHIVNLKLDFVNGRVPVGVMHSLPVTGVHLLLGNDLAGDKVVVNPLVTANPSLDQIDPIEIEIPDLYPGCAVTRAMAKKTLSNEVEISLSDTFMGHLPEVTSTSVYDRIDLHSSDPSVSTSSNNSSNQGEEFSQLSKSQLLKEQENDPELNSLFQMATADSEIDQVPTCYYLKNGILMRKYRPPEISADDEWQVKHQIVVPKSYRQEILSLAHETPLAGHLGVNKTYNKILNHFYWPKMRRDVAKFCQSCHTCQMVGKPNQKIPKACLQPIPAIDEPFSRVIVDCVGPLPKTKLGNQYLLTIMCSSTRFPEAIPLRNIKAKGIVKALIKFFTLVGLPKSIQSDQGSNFMSGIFQQVMYELDIKQLTSSAYHPER